MSYKYLAIFLVILMSYSAQTSAKEHVSRHKLMYVAKLVGTCEVLSEMQHFQKRSKISGGDGFISKFWAVEAARQGLTMHEYYKRCHNAFEAYNKLWGASEHKPHVQKK